MFYSQIILAKKSPLGKIWLAAHWEKKLSKTQIFQTNITATVDSIVNPTVPLALRVSGHLLLGLVRIYSRKVRYLMTDCTEALTKIKLAFRPGVVDLPAGASEAAAAAINVAGFGDFADIDLADPFAIDGPIPEADDWIATTSATVARRQDITMSDHESTSMVSNGERSAFFAGFDDGDAWMTVGKEGGGGVGGSSTPLASAGRRSRAGRVSDVEAARHADTSSAASARARMSIDASASRDRSMSLGGAADVMGDLGPATLPADLDADITLPPEEFGDFPAFEPAEMPMPDLYPNVDAEEAPLPGAVRMDDSADEGEKKAEISGVQVQDEEEEAAATGALAQVMEAGEPGAAPPQQMQEDEEGLEGLEAPAKRRKTKKARKTALDSDEEEEAAPRKTTRKPRKQTRTRKRKLELDEVMDIDSATMKRHLTETGDIVRRRTSRRELVQQIYVASAEELLSAPIPAGLAVEIEELVVWTAEPAPLPFPMPRLRATAASAAAAAGGQAAGGADQEAAAAAAAAEGGEQEQEDVELARRGRRSESLSLAPDDVQAAAAAAQADLREQDMQFEAQGPELAALFEPGEAGNEMPAFDQDLEFGAPQQMEGDGQDAEEQQRRQNEEQEMQEMANSRVSVGEPGEFALAAIDDLERDEEKDAAEAAAMGGVTPAEAAAEAAELAAAAAAASGPPPERQWHPQTVKVMQVVRKQLKQQQQQQEQQQEVEGGEAADVTFARLARGAKRRTAASCFFELLQLKTWDYVELQQAEAYGDITITRGRHMPAGVEVAAS